MPVVSLRFTLSAGTHQDDLEHHSEIVSLSIETQVANWVYTAPQTKVFSAQTSDVVIFRRRSRCGPCTWSSGFAEQESFVQLRSSFSAPPRDRQLTGGMPVYQKAESSVSCRLTLLYHKERLRRG